jgi:hypothetical protein
MTNPKTQKKFSMRGNYARKERIQLVEKKKENEMAIFGPIFVPK